LILGRKSGNLIKILLSNQEDFMTFTGNEDHAISLEDAAVMTKRYRDGAGPNPFLGGFFGGKAISDILKQDNCVGIRIYMAKDSNGKETFVVVGANADEDDLTGGLIAEFIQGCPPRCPDSSPLAGT
jgi:hypothetical protein